MNYFIVDNLQRILLLDGAIPNLSPCTLPKEDQQHNISLWNPQIEGRAFGVEEVIAQQIVDDNSNYQWVGLREAWKKLCKTDFDAAVHAAMWVYWNRTTRYCSCCGAELIREEEMGKRCPQCGQMFYPQLSPAVIVRVDKTDSTDCQKKTLLARAALRPAFFGLVSGFIEGGETFEECVCRELREETGIEIKNLQYFGSQSWPFPSGVMIGFTAEYESGEICLKDGELLEADFYTKEQILTMNIPQPFSISRQLLDQWILDVNNG